MASYKKLANKGNIFLVVRRTLDVTGIWANAVNIGAFSHLEDADEACGMWKQQWVDKVGHDKYVLFEVELTTFYG